MGTITISIKDNVERDFRESVKEKVGNSKGSLGKAVEEALKIWIEEKKQREIAERGLELTKKGLYSLKGWKFNRDEIYDRGL